jgi:CRP-like cAMP-binding protein
MTDVVGVLGKVPLFESVSKKDLRALAGAAHEMAYEPGTYLTKKEEMGATFFVVVEGEAAVVVEGHPAHRLREGDYFGEMSIIDRAPRSADVVAVSSLRCLVFTYWTFRPFLKQHPDVAWAMLEVMARRVREAQSPATTAPVD